MSPYAIVADITRSHERCAELMIAALSDDNVSSETIGISAYVREMAVTVFHNSDRPRQLPPNYM